MAFGLGSTPPPAATLEQVFGALEWIAPGFEFVQCHQPGWKFEATHTVADGGLHAGLLDARLGTFQAGDVVTTGTWTDAWPVEFSDALPALGVRSAG